MGSALSTITKDCSPLHSFKSACQQKIILWVMWILSSRCSKSFEKDTIHATKVQGK